MKVSLLLQKLQPKQHSRSHPGHHHSGSIKWEHHGEKFTNADYQVTEWEIRAHHMLEAQSQVERLSN